MARHYIGPRGVVNRSAAEVPCRAVIRKRFLFRGTIQGVGFRPAIYRLAVSLGLTGFVQNRRSEVVAEVQGEEDSGGAVQLPARRRACPLPPGSKPWRSTIAAVHAA